MIERKYCERLKFAWNLLQMLFLNTRIFVQDLIILFHYFFFLIDKIDEPTEPFLFQPKHKHIVDESTEDK